MVNTTQIVSWDEVDHDSAALAGLLAGQGPFDGIVAVSRGGLVPAAILAGRLNIRRIETLCVRAYEGREAGAVEVIKPPVIPRGGRWLGVDDLVDSGATARLLRRMIPGLHMAVLYAKPAGRALADTFVREVPSSLWLVFPWEAD